MSSDRARRSYDVGRMYRSVVSQQGRVTLEADANEADEIRAEESRAELIDVIGPSGAPDDGFAISVPAGLDPFDFSIGAGTLYVGGERVINADESASYVGQRKSEWTDYPAGWESEEPSTGPINEAVYLTLAEQEVTAVEDEALREVALGGPDTCARVRLIQRVQRWRVDGSSCDVAFPQVLKDAHGETATFDSATMRLESKARLRVDFLPRTDPTDVCQPTAQAGFLGAENQLIRVQVLDTDTMLWGWDNASFLYRVTVADLPGPKRTLTLNGIPVDGYHHPRKGQWVELLGAAVDLGGGAYVASPVGVALQVDEYEAAYRLVTLATTIPGNLVDKHPLFLRMWENKLPFAADETTPTELVDAANVGTGVRVFTTKTRRVPGDHWMIGVRPSTPQAILPARLATFQPPDGPHRWVAPLAVIEWDQEGRAERVTDCRPPFLDLVELTSRKAGCCELVVSPGESIQAAIDSLPPEGGAVCLRAGTHRIETAIRIARSGVTLHGESAGAVVEAALPGPGPAPVEAVMLDISNGDDGLSDVTIRDLVFVATAPPADVFAGLVRIDRCARAQVRGCRFIAPAPSAAAIASCSAIGATGCRDLVVNDNVLEGMYIGLVANALLGRIEVQCNTIVGLSMRLPVAPGQTGEVSGGLVGIGVLPDPAGATLARAFVSHNKLDHFQRSIGLGPVLDGSSVHDNTIHVGLSTVTPGQFPTDDTELPRYLDRQQYAISCASNHCVIRANRIELHAPSCGGIRTTGHHTTVHANVIVASPREGQGRPVGIFAMARSNSQGAHHAIVRDNVLVGPLAGITVSGCAAAEVSRNHIEGAGMAPYAVGLVSVRDAAGVLLAISDALVNDNRVTAMADGRAAIFANGGHQNRFEGNQIRGCSNGIITRDQTDVELRDNRVQDARMGGISLERLTGIALIVGNRVLNCGFFNEQGHGIDVQGGDFAGAHLRVEGCEIIDTGVGGPLPTKAAGIFANRLQSCQLVGNRVGYTNLEAVTPNDPHPAVSLRGLSEEGNERGQAMINANHFTGTGPMLVAVSGFQKGAFSNNICSHRTEVDGSATVVLSGAHLIALGNHIEANDPNVPSFSLSSWVMGSFSGNLTTGDIADANPLLSPGTLVPSPYLAYNIKL